MRKEILSLLSGQKIDTAPAFSGLIHITDEGLEREGLKLHEVHHDAGKMARAAASTFKLTGIPSAALPLDLCAPAEALGAELNYEGDGFPQVREALFKSTAEVGGSVIGKLGSRNWENARIRLICESIQLVKEDIGKDVVISGLIPGPYTLLLYMCNPANLFMEMKKEPQIVAEALFHLSSFLGEIGKAYREAGADFITIHDMGGSPGFIGPARFEQFVIPALEQLIADLPGPAVLSVCGSTNKSMELLARAGADAVSVDQTNDLAASRAALKDTLLFGNLDPVGALWQGDEASITEAVRGAKEAGVDAVWPGCDLVPQTTIANIRTLLSA